MIKLMAKERIHIQMVPSISVSGKMISKMGSGLRNGSMAKNTKANTKTEQKQAKEYLSFWMAATTKVNF
jgi:hypothetical protein